MTIDRPGSELLACGESVATGSSGPPAVAETHSGVVFFLGDRAYKLKKPLDLGFLDFRSREARHAACEREVALNRRLAPDVYLGVANMSGPDGRLLDHLVVMRRMPDDRRLASLVVSGAPVMDHLDRVAVLLARFHRDAERASWIDDAAGVDAEARRWKANAIEMERFRGRVLDPQVLDDVMSMSAGFLAGRRPLFEQRVAQGRACDGHGDLLADDIFCLDDGPRVLDCLEFDNRLRVGDVLGDVAFLAMDLERLGRPDLAAHFLDRYRIAAGDSWPDSLAHHHIAYRAQVRAKVACLRWAQGDPAAPAQADALLRLCRDHLRRGTVRLIIVGGLPGTGKSTVARGVAAPLGAVVLRSDEIRKELAGVDPGSHAPAGLNQGLYGPSSTEATYAELLSRARTELGLGRSVVLDATWCDPTWQRAARRLATDASAELSELRCVAPLEVAVGRVARRLSGGADVSDATEDVTRHLAASNAPWIGATDVDTAGEAGQAITAALTAIVGAAEQTDQSTGATMAPAVGE